MLLTCTEILLLESIVRRYLLLAHLSGLVYAESPLLPTRSHSFSTAI